MEELAAAIAKRGGAAKQGESADGALDTVAHAKLRQMMKPEQLQALYAMFFADAEKRLATMRVALQESDDAEFRRCSHAIKGGCGMVGARELHELARRMEDNGIGSGSLDSLDGFLLAIERLRRILVQIEH
jgi:HPt (histidine-containing phosphotransfer) domain-containing protein